MFPLHTFIDAGPTSPYLWGGEVLSDGLESWEMGGVGISDPSGGLMFQLWHAELDLATGTVLLDAPNTPQFVLYSEAGITQMDFSFDQNMKPCLAFTQNGVAKFWWYNAVNSQYEIVVLTGAMTPLVVLDDKRPVGVNNSDIVLVYLRDGSLYCRDQRDRFLIEYDLNIRGIKRLVRMGFSTGLRIQIQVIV
jgi:hypothetical protein